MSACLELKRIWEDIDFFEINMLAHSPYCDININFYTTNQELENLRKGITTLNSNQGFVWTSGADTEDVTHYVYLRFFFCSSRGHVAIEVLTDNKLSSPYHVRASFFIITEPGSLDDFTVQLDKFINGTTPSVEGIIFCEM